MFNGGMQISHRSMRSGPLALLAPQASSDVGAGSTTKPPETVMSDKLAPCRATRPSASAAHSLQLQLLQMWYAVLHAEVLGCQPAIVLTNSDMLTIQSCHEHEAHSSLFSRSVSCKICLIHDQAWSIRSIVGMSCEDATPSLAAPQPHHIDSCTCKDASRVDPNVHDCLNTHIYASIWVLVGTCYTSNEQGLCGRLQVCQHRINATIISSSSHNQ